MINYKTAVILCGGKGTRLGNIGKKLPKTLIQIQKKPILWYIINELINHGGFDHFILPVGHQGDKIEKYIKKNFFSKKYESIKFDIIKTGINTSISNRIFKVSSKIISDHFLLLNGDAIFSFKLKKFFFEHIKNNTDLTLFACNVISAFGVVITNNLKPVNFKRDMIYGSINGKQKNVTGEIYTGMSIIKTELLKKIKFKNSNNFEMNFFPKILMSKKYNSELRKVNGFWYAMDDLKAINLTKINLNKNSISINIRKINKYLNDK